MDSLKGQVLLRLREKLPEASDAEILEYVERAEEYFKAHTKRLNVPVRALFLWLDMALEVAKTPTENGGEVSSIKRGDTTINYTEGQKSGLSRFAADLAQYKVVVAK